MTSTEVCALVLNNALYVPSYKQDIFSVNAAVGEGGSISLDKQNKRFKSSDGATFNIEQVGRLYYLSQFSTSEYFRAKRLFSFVST